MKVLVIGSGAREHALASRLSTEPDVAEIAVAPGNPGISAVARTIPADLTDVAALARLAQREHVDLTVVGPELPLSLGVADRFAENGQLLFGPTEAAARLESSKAFAKAFMERHSIPTARFRTCDTMDEAMSVIGSDEFGFPVVLKADGLAAGKGVVIAAGRSEAELAVRGAMADRRFGDAGSRIVIEEHLTGPEVSFFAISDGSHALPIGTAQDHKRIFDDDRGPNTGGMGAFAPSPLIDSHLHARVMRDVVERVIAGMAAEGHPFCGFLYVGLMLTAEGPKVIEFNARLGDPEAQVILSLIGEPLLPLLVAGASGALHQPVCRLTSEKLVAVVLASRGYPESSESGRPISGIGAAERIPGVQVYHGGTAVKEGHIVTAGGRVLTIVGRGETFSEAISVAYKGVSQVRFDGMQYRSDIGRRALNDVSAGTTSELGR